MTTERPIIMSGHSVPRILDETKTQTRRVINPQPHRTEPATGLLEGIPIHRPAGWAWKSLFSADKSGVPFGSNLVHSCRPYGIPGDRLWVRETWRPEELDTGLDGIRFKAGHAFVGIANTREAGDAWVHVNTHPGRKDRWRSPLFMPRWASRILLEVTEVRVEQLQDITARECFKEGLPDTYGDAVLAQWPDIDDIEPHVWDNTRSVDRFAELWDQLNAKRGFEWAANPWVTVTTFKLVSFRLDIS